MALQTGPKAEGSGTRLVAAVFVVLIFAVTAQVLATTVMAATAMPAQTMQMGKPDCDPGTHHEGSDTGCNDAIVNARSPLCLNMLRCRNMPTSMTHCQVFGLTARVECPTVSFTHVRADFPAIEIRATGQPSDPIFHPPIL